jgi:precorrin-6B C5,15-methyltransferase / cobalt-precorrin-6B C5,C15-methyltransferase
MNPWLAIIGVGEGGLDGLSRQARALIDGASLLIGGERHLALLPEGGAERRRWPTPLSRAVEEIMAWRGRSVVALATGDPMWFGIGVSFAQQLPPEELLVLPAPSAFSLASARLGWPLADVECLSLHGRPLDLLNGVVAPRARLLLLSSDASTPAAVAARLVALGYGESRMIVLEHMGGHREQRHEATAASWSDRPVADLNLIAVDCVAGAAAIIRSRLPGLPDSAFEHDGQLTKREVRAATLAALAPLPGECLWDIGAGSGAVAIEWLRSSRSLSAIAIERDAARVELIRRNAAALGTPQLQIVDGEAPAVLAGLPSPDAVFIGGGLAAPGLVDTVWSALPRRGRLVANAVTLESEALLVTLFRQWGGTLTRIAVSHVEPIGAFHAWKPLMPVTQLAVVKP